MTLRQPVLGGVGREPTRHDLLERLAHVVGLALVLEQRRDLAVERRGHVDDDVGGWPAHHPDLGDLPVGQPLVADQLGVRERVARVGVDRPPRRVAGGHVVGVAGADAGEVPLRALHEHPLRAHLADHPGDVTAQLVGRLHLPVPIAEQPHVVHAEHLAGRALLGHPDVRDVLAGHGGVEPAGVTGGHQAVGHRDARVGPLRDRAAGPVVDIVGMGDDDERPLDVSVLQHGRSPPRSWRARAIVVRGGRRPRSAVLHRVHDHQRGAGPRRGRHLDSTTR